MTEQQDQLFHGNEPVHERLNLRRELAMFEENPLNQLYEILNQRQPPSLLHNEITRSAETHWLYFLCLERFLGAMSVSVRWQSHLRWVHGRKYTEREHKLSQRYREVGRYAYLDFFNCLLYARILCDRTIALSRHFLDNRRKLSFTSFYNHKQFFLRLQRQQVKFGKHEEYARRICDATDWFDMPLKAVRDHYLVHAGPQHMRFMGYEADYDLQMTLLVPEDPRSARPFANFRVIRVSIRRLARDIHAFLSWFGQYGASELLPHGTC